MIPSNPQPDAAAYGRRASDRKSQRSQWLMIIVLSLAVVYVVYQQVAAKIGENAATSTAQDLAGPVDELCRTDPSARQQIGNEKCGQAAEVQRESTDAIAPRDGTDGENGRDGRDGKNGRGITSTAVVDGHLFVTYTDGVREDKGVIAVDGHDGRGISGAALLDGQLVLTYTDGASETVGRIVGRDGTNGRGITDVVVSDDYRVIVTYTDGTIEDVGALPPGPPGATGVPGRGVQTVDFNMAACEAKITYTDGYVETKSMTGCTPAQPPTETTTTTTDGLPIPTG